MKLTENTLHTKCVKRNQQNSSTDLRYTIYFAFFYAYIAISFIHILQIKATNTNYHVIHHISVDLLNVLDKNIVQSSKLHTNKNNEMRELIWTLMHGTLELVISSRVEKHYTPWIDMIHLPCQYPDLNSTELVWGDVCSVK